ncbi:MAG TPA: septal ring lytic transglycosylase RlpA family protein [Acidimicrobiales bacterium]|nr:septal ring lytic transglycosylase RlpA family protein [Acidimicrobiales bacterium]
MRRTLLVLLVGALLGAFATPATAEEPAKTAAQLRAERRDLIAQIATLTDQSVRAQQALADARARQDFAADALVEARVSYAEYAVDAYIKGVQATEVEQLKQRAYSDTLAETDRQALVSLKELRRGAETEEALAEDALERAAEVTGMLEVARAELEKTLSERVAFEAAQAKAARAHSAASGGLTVPRHRRATMGQYDLMRTYRFGPGPGVPAGLVATGQVFEGKASWYGPGFNGRPTASGAIFDQEGWTVAHRTLPLGTILLISRGDREVVALVNDRGPFVGGRVLDLSHGVANALGTVHAGVASVRAEILVPA